MFKKIGVSSAPEKVKNNSSIVKPDQWNELSAENT